MSISPQPLHDRPVPRSRSRWCASLIPSCALAVLLQTGPSPLGEVSASPRPHKSLHEEILLLLERPESLLRSTDWAPLGPDALSELLGLASNPRAPEPQRTRAVTAMAVVAHPDAAQRIQELLRGLATPSSVRAAATLALGRRSGLAAFPLLTPLLEDPSAQVRATAAQTLGRMGGSEARKLLEARLPIEEDLAVREAIQQGLSYTEP